MNTFLKNAEFIYRPNLHRLYIVHVQSCNESVTKRPPRGK